MTRKGFTLIELLVVISIIALLMAIMMPALGKVRELGRRTVCSTNVKGFALANITYSADFSNSCLPYTAKSTSLCAKYGGHGQVWFWNDSFRQMLGTKDKVATDPGYWATLGEKFKCPSDRRKVGAGLWRGDGEEIDISYGFNITCKDTYNWPAVTSKPYVKGFKMDSIKKPSKKIAFMDGTDGGLYEAAADWHRFWDVYGDWSGAPVPTWNTPAYRHGQGANISFFDGHSAYMAKEDIYLLDEFLRPVKTGANSLMWRPLEDF